MIRSNIKSIITRLERYQSGLPVAVNNALRPEKYTLHLEVVARRTLMALADTKEEQALVPHFLATIRSEVLGANGMLFRMRSPDSERVGSVVEAQRDYEDSRTRLYPDGGKGERRVPLAMDPDMVANLDVAREAVSQWVRFEKILDDRDAGISLEEVTDRILWIMGLNTQQRFGDKNYTGLMRESAEALALRVQSFWESAGRGGAQASGTSSPKWGDADSKKDKEGAAIFGGASALLTPAMTHQWLMAVLLAWREALRDRLRLALKRELATLRHRVKHELI